MVKREGGQTRQEIAAMISGYESLRYDLTWFAKCARTDVSHSNECKRNHEITNETSELIHRASVFVKQQLGSFSTTLTKGNCIIPRRFGTCCREFNAKRHVCLYIVFLTCCFFNMHFTGAICQSFFYSL